MNRVVKCPSEFPPGYFWYGSKRHGPGRPPKWIDRLVKKSTTPGEVSDDSDEERLSDANSDTKFEAENSELEPENEPSELEPSPAPQTQHFTHTHTRTVKPSNRLTKIRSGSS